MNIVQVRSLSLFLYLFVHCFCVYMGRMKNNRHFGYPETKITDFKISGTRLGTTLHHCRLVLEMETEPGTKSRFHYYLCLQATTAR